LRTIIKVKNYIFNFQKITYNTSSKLNIGTSKNCIIIIMIIIIIQTFVRHTLSASELNVRCQSNKA